MNMYAKFAFITIAFLIANTTAFSIGLALTSTKPAFLSVPSILAISGVLLANCAAIQLLIAGKFSLSKLFYIGLIPIAGYFLAYYMIKNGVYSNIGFIIYSLSLTAGVYLLIMTLKHSENREGLVL